jgi:putative transposase
MLRKQENKNLCERILREVAFCHKIEITELTVMPDHIHIIVFIPPTMNFRKRYPKGHFWSPGKFYRSVGDANTETVMQYVRDQRLVQTTLGVHSIDS